MSGKALPWTDQAIERVRRLRADGASLDYIGDAVGRTKWSVKSLIKRLNSGIPKPRQRMQLPPADDDEKDYFGPTHIEQDMRFQAAMEAAGYKRHVVTEPCTRNPIELRPETIGMIARRGWVW
jgi:hypothetical protein